MGFINKWHDLKVYRWKYMCEIFILNDPGLHFKFLYTRTCICFYVWCFSLYKINGSGDLSVCIIMYGINSRLSIDFELLTYPCGIDICSSTGYLRHLDCWFIPCIDFQKCTV